MKTYFVKGRGYDKREKREEIFEVTFDVDEVNSANFNNAYYNALNEGGVLIIETLQIIVLN